MPELPEVELVTRRLAAALHGGAKITGIEVLRGRYLEGDLQILEHAHITKVLRHGKNILMRFVSPGTMRNKDTLLSHTLVCHLGMSGYWDTTKDPWSFDYVEGKRESSDSDVRVKMKFIRSGGLEDELRFHDARLFGKLKAYPPGILPQIGPEIIQTPFQYKPQGVSSGHDLWKRMLDRPRWEIKRALMEQSIVAGLGNIYATEALYVAGIHPATPVKEVEHWDTLFAACQDQLIGAIMRNLEYACLAVYRRKTCRRDETPIQSVKIAGRTSYFCPTCQPPPT